MFPTYKHNALHNQSYHHRPEWKVLDSFDTAEFAEFQQIFRASGVHTAMPAWSAEGMHLKIFGDDILKLDTQFINIPKTIAAKERFYTGDLAMFIVMNYQVNL
jgi:hypothetical protein